MSSTDQNSGGARETGPAIDPRDLSGARTTQKQKGLKTRAWLWWAAIAGFLAFLAQYIKTFDHKLLQVSVGVTFLAFSASARSFWIQYTNNHGKHVDAYVRAFAIVSFGALICGFLFWRSSQLVPAPKILLSVEIENSGASVVLTNSSLGQMRRHLVGTTNNPRFNLYAQNCLFIPVGPTQSNAVFRFYVRNQSSVTIHDTRLAVALPEEWHCLLDPAWRQMKMFMNFPGFKEMGLTNMHCWAAQGPGALFPTDGWHSPSIINFSVVPPNARSNLVPGIAIHVQAAEVAEQRFTAVFFFSYHERFQALLMPSGC